jgi:hypothetical protein
MEELMVKELKERYVVSPFRAQSNNGKDSYSVETFSPLANSKRSARGVKAKEITTAATTTTTTTDHAMVIAQNVLLEKAITTMETTEEVIKNQNKNVKVKVTNLTSREKNKGEGTSDRSGATASFEVEETSSKNTSVLELNQNWDSIVLGDKTDLIRQNR